MDHDREGLHVLERNGLFMVLVMHMKGSGLYIGREGHDVVPVERRAWKEPWLVGGILVLVYAIYEGAKVVGVYASESIVYQNYTVLLGLSSITSSLYSFFLISAMILSFLFIFIVSNGRKKETVVIFIIVSFIIIWIAFFIVLVRFMVDCVLLKCADPLTEWIIKYYWEGELAIEFRVLPDLMMNALCMVGIVLSTVTLGSHSKTIHTAVKILDDESAFPSDAFISDDGNRRMIRCKVKDGIKACSL